MNPLVVAALVAALTCSEASANGSPSSKEVTRAAATAKQALLDRLRDADSAKFRNVFVSRGPAFDVQADYTLFLCGEVNARNEFGGYTGFTRFAADPAGEAIRLETSTNGEVFRNVVWAEWCGNRLQPAR
jgi:hypothetical protein